MLSNIHDGNHGAKLIHNLIRLRLAQAGHSETDNPGTTRAAGTWCDITAAEIISARIYRGILTKHKFMNGNRGREHREYQTFFQNTTSSVTKT